jgi:hypothetical protein
MFRLHGLDGPIRTKLSKAERKMEGELAEQARKKVVQNTLASGLNVKGAFSGFKKRMSASQPPPEELLRAAEARAARAEQAAQERATRAAQERAAQESLRATQERPTFSLDEMSPEEMIAAMDEDDLARMREVFVELDQDGNGMVDFEEFSSAIARLLDMDEDSDDSEEETIPPEKVQAIWQTICRPPAEEVPFPVFAQWYVAHFMNSGGTPDIELLMERSAPMSRKESKSSSYRG